MGTITTNEPRFILGDRLRERRMAARLTQQDLATACGVDKATISRIERKAHTTNSVDFLMRLSAVLKCNGYYLLGMRDDHGPAFIPTARHLELIRYFDQLDERGQLVSIGVLKEALEVQNALARQKSDTGCK